MLTSLQKLRTASQRKILLICNPWLLEVCVFVSSFFSLRHRESRHTVHGYSLLRTQLNNDYFHDLFDESAKFGIEIEGHRMSFLSCQSRTKSYFTCADTETGPGVLETALAYTSALRMADNAVLFKYVAKSIGMKHGIVPSFMAKPWGNVSFYILITSSTWRCFQLPGCSGWEVLCNSL